MYAQQYLSALADDAMLEGQSREMLADVRARAAGGASEARLISEVILPGMERIVESFVSTLVEHGRLRGEHVAMAVYNPLIGSAFIRLEDYRDLLAADADVAVVQRHLASIIELYWPATSHAVSRGASIRKTRCFVGIKLFGWKIGWETEGPHSAVADSQRPWSGLDGNVKVVLGLTTVLTIVGLSAVGWRRFKA